MANASWLIGVTMNLLGSIILNVGTNFMKFGFIIKKQLEASEPGPGADTVGLLDKKVPTPRVWYIGVALMVLGGITVFASLGFAPQSLLAPLGSIQFVSNVFLGRFLLKERVTMRVVVATALLMLGSALSVAFGDHEHQEYNLDKLKHLYTPGYLAYLACLAVLCGALHVTYLKYHERALQGGHMLLPHHKYVYPLSYCNVSAIIGTQGAIFAKAASHIIADTAGGDNQLKFPMSWFFVAGAVGGSIFWLTRMNSALRKFDGLFIIPALQVCWISWILVSAGTYFREFNALAAWQIIGFAASIAIIFAGVFLLVPQDEDEELRRHSFSDPKLDQGKLDALRGVMGGHEMLTEMDLTANIHRLRQKTASLQELTAVDKQRMDAIQRYTNMVVKDFPEKIGGLVNNIASDMFDGSGAAGSAAGAAPMEESVGVDLDADGGKSVEEESKQNGDGAMQMSRVSPKPGAALV